MDPIQRKQYDREYRQKNKDRIRERRRVWRSQNRKKVTESEVRRRQRKRARLEIEVEPAYNHPLYQKAIKLVKTARTNPIWEDHVSVVVLAILDRKNPLEQLNKFIRQEIAWNYLTMELTYQ